MKASIDRLRKSRQSAAVRRYASGVAAGKSWALEHAEYEELERVAPLTEQLHARVMKDAGDAIEAAFEVWTLARAASTRVFELQESDAITTDAGSEVRRLFRMIEQKAQAIATALDGAAE